MTQSYLLDTNAVSDIAKMGDIKQRAIAIRLADEIDAGSLLCISSVTLFEMR
ncbi:type II toxin-antitoxin system VapC family toxin [Ampullimonas aquatilis]|uniref:type II toxin-antitoxin system VapC family toxin n=1 Tax=Ampullimonas aquatilis TaxID=1341549 RepID=UPI003C769D24